MSISNLGLYFYRDYYDMRSGFDPRTFSDEGHKKKQEAYFKEKNKALLAHKPSETQTNIALNPLSNQHLQTVIQAPGMLLGTGYTHETGQLGEFKLGFFFDHTSGLPIVPGSSVKGKLRSAFPQFTRGKHGKSQWDLPKETRPLQRAKAFNIHHLLWGDATRNFEKEPLTEAEMTDITMLTKVHHLELAIFEGIDIDKTIKNNNVANNELVYLNSYARTIFFDASILYQADKAIFQNDTITPHTAGQFKNPTPLLFLMLKAGTQLQFSWRLHDVILSETDNVTVSAEAKKNLFADLLMLYGIGAKTSVNYGQLDWVGAEKTKREAARQAQVAQAANIPNSTEFEGATISSIRNNTVLFSLPLHKEAYPYGRSIQFNSPKELNAYCNNPNKKKYTLVRTIINDVETWSIKNT